MIHGAVTFEIFVMLRIVMIKIHVSHLLLRHTRSIKKEDNVMHRDRLVTGDDDQNHHHHHRDRSPHQFMRQLSSKALFKNQGKT